MFQLLGAVDAVVGSGRVELGSPKQRVVLAVLLVEAGRPVGTDLLVDRVWDEAPAGDARRMLSTYVSRLRRVLTGLPVELVRRPGGYELRVEPDLVDLHRFRRLVGAAEDPRRPEEERAGLLREALDLWHGPALSDLPGEWAERTRQSWHQHRLDATLAWARLELGLGRQKNVIGTIRDLATGHPPVEPLVGVLMRALDMDGRTAEALDLFATTRKLLADELGVEPGGELRAVHESLLRVADRPTPGPSQLPANLADFVGRTDELAVLRTALDRGTRLAAVSGPPGVGKTALALRIGHELASRFPDGQLYVALRGASAEPADPAEVLAQLLRSLGVDGSALPAGADARGALFRDRLAGRQVLLVLDDAGGHRQVEPLLPAGGAAVLVTSRAPLTGLPGVTAIDLRPLPRPAAIELLARVAGESRVRAELAMAADLVTTCGGLPLAVRIAAARLAAHPHWTVEKLARRLTDERRRLDELRHGDLAVRPGLQVAYQGLDPAARRAFALLGRLDVPSFPEWPVAAMLGADASALDELVEARLVDELGPDCAGQPRYRFHEITKAYAQECQSDRDEWVDALARAAAGWLAMARQARDRLQCERLLLDGEPGAGAPVSRPLDWFEAERDVLAVLVPRCAEAGLSDLARGLAGCAADFYVLRGYYDDWRRTTESALAACRQTGDRAGAAAMTRSLGTCMIEFDDLDGALAMLRAALTEAEEVGDPVGAAMARRYIGFALGLVCRFDEAEAQLRTAADQLRLAGSRANESVTLTNLGFVLRQRGDLTTAITTIRAALTIAGSCGDLFAQAYATRGLAGAQLDAGQTQDGEHSARRSAELFTRIGDQIGAAQGLRVLGEALATAPHRADEAHQVLTTAATIFQERGFAWGLALVELSLGELEVRRRAPTATARLHHALRFWTNENIPLLRARALVALATAAEQTGDPSARELLLRAYHLYEELDAPQTAELAERLGIPHRSAV